MSHFIPAPARWQLATNHHEDGYNLRPLLGWALDPDARDEYGDRIDGPPIVLDGVHASVIGSAHGWTVVTGDEVDGFDLDAWGEAANRAYVATIGRARAHLLERLTERAQSVRYDTAPYYAALDLVSEGLAVWQGNGNGDYRSVKKAVAPAPYTDTTERNDR